MSTVREEPSGTQDWRGWVVFVLLAFVWGGSFILIKKGLVHFTPTEVGAWRVAISGFAFVPIFLLSKVKFPKGKVWMIITIVLLGNGIPAFLFALAETRLGSAVSGVLNSLTPIFALLLGVLFFGTKFKKHYIIGLLLGCLGISVLVAGEKDWHVSSYVFFIVIATICYGLSANLVKRYCQDIHPVAVTSVGFFFLGIICTFILLQAGTFQKLSSKEVWSVSMSSMLILALVCTVFANVLFYWLLQRTTVVFGSAIAYAIPCMALVWGSVDGEVITWYQFAGFGFIIAAVYTLRKH